MIIAIGHEPQVGKDTMVMFIMDDLRQRFQNLDIQREGFADRIYKLCEELYGWAGFRTRIYYQNNPKEKELILPKIGKTPRQLVIGVAEGVRAFDPESWLRPVYLNRPKHAKFVTDLRTEEEVSAGRAYNAYLVRVDNPNAPQIECKISAILKKWTGWDEVLVNDGSLTKWKHTCLSFSERVIVPHIQAVLRGDTRVIHG